MASLLYVYCSNCVHAHCAATQLTREVLNSMKRENEVIFGRIMFMKMIYVFCKKREGFRVINIIE